MLKRNVMYPAVITREDEVYYIGLVDFNKLEDGTVDYYHSFSEDLEKRDRMKVTKIVGVSYKKFEDVN